MTKKEAGDQTTPNTVKTDWTHLAKHLGSLRDDGSELGGDNYARQAFEEILGNEWIENTIEHIISSKPGGELAMNCLRYLSSTKATKYAYQVYKSSSGERSTQAVWLIKHLANPISLDWVEEFLNDKNVMHWGIGVLDQLLWTERIPYDERVESLLVLAEKNSNGELKEEVDFIRRYLSERSSV